MPITIAIVAACLIMLWPKKSIQAYKKPGKRRHMRVKNSRKPLVKK